MKTYPLIYLLAVGMAVTGLGASAAEPDISGLGVWEKAPHVLKDPARKLYIATSKPLGADGELASQFDVWGKLIYDEPQHHGRYGVMEEWVEMRLDCATMRYTARRYAMLDGKGNVLVDATLTDPPKRVHKAWGDPDYMRFMELTADIAGRKACAVHPD